MAAKLDNDTDIVTAGLTHTISRNEVIDFRVASNLQILARKFGRERTTTN